MAQQIINVGTAPNDGTGDPIRTAYIKCNDNFTELYGRSTVTTANDGVFDTDLGDNFSCTTAENTTLTWTNIVSGRSGSVVLSNLNGYNITKSTNVMCASGFLSTVSTSGVYLVGYFTDGVNVYLNSSSALS